MNYVIIGGSAGIGKQIIKELDNGDNYIFSTFLNFLPLEKSHYEIRSHNSADRC